MDWTSCLMVWNIRYVAIHSCNHRHRHWIDYSLVTFVFHSLIASLSPLVGMSSVWSRRPIWPASLLFFDHKEFSMPNTMFLLGMAKKESSDEWSNGETRVCFPQAQRLIVSLKEKHHQWMFVGRAAATAKGGYVFSCSFLPQKIKNHHRRRANFPSGSFWVKCELFICQLCQYHPRSSLLRRTL